VQDRGDDRRVRPSPAWAGRRRRGGAEGDSTSAEVRERVCDGAREAMRTRKVATTAGVGVGCDGASRRGSRRSPPRRHGRRRARRPRSVRASASGFTAVVGCIQGDQGHGALFPSLFATVHEALGHGEAATVRSGQTQWRRPTREGRAKAQPGPQDLHAHVLGCTVARGVGFARRRARAQARTRTRSARRGVADASGNARRTTTTREG
jgi:hypothetical protein